jgi:cell wall-associated NlpC family hydrolase
MLFMSRGAGRTFVAVLATGVFICAASSVTAQDAVASAPALGPRQLAGMQSRPPRHGHTLYFAHLHARLLAQQVVRAALRQQGVPYSYGGSSPASGFDCSGLVYWSYAQIGVSVPHSSYTLATFGTRVALRHLQPGDVLVFHDEGHVGIYIGRGRFVHAPHSGTRVRVERLSARVDLERARRVIPRL